MKEFDRQLAVKFFNNECSRAEAEKVLDWLETPDGSRFLEERMELDFEEGEEEPDDLFAANIDSESLYIKIERRIVRLTPDFKKRNKNSIKIFLQLAAVFFVIAIASLFYITQNTIQTENEIAEPIFFSTSEDEQREIRLGDGTDIRLNSSSNLKIPNDFLKDTREVTLNGEAFFDVKYIADQPFKVHTEFSKVEVLGTSFNIRSIAGEDNIQVAVMDGKVAFQYSDYGTLANNSFVVLEAGQYGFMNIKEGTIEVDNIAVENYLSWKSGQLIFNTEPLETVCMQLFRLFSLQCTFDNREIRELKLTANFNYASITNTLSVIALSLNLDYSISNGVVNWSDEIYNK